MNIVYSSDEKFAMILAVSLVSLYTANKGIDECNVYIIDTGISEESRSRLQRIAQAYHRSLHITEPVDAEVFSGIELKCQNKWSPAAFCRLFIGVLFPDMHRTIYLDCDTLVRHDLTPLWDIDLGEHSCAAVCEPFGKWHKKAVGLMPSDQYINTGIMLIDVDAWRAQNMMEQFTAYIQELDGTIPFVDQGVINHVLKNRITRLPMKYNCTTIYYDFGFSGTEIARGAKNDYSQTEVDASLTDPAIIHYTNSYVSNRPWLIDSRHPFAKEWLALKALTPWAESPLWADNRSRDRKICRAIYNHLPRKCGYHFTYMVNGWLRPLLKK